MSSKFKSHQIKKGKSIASGLEDEGATDHTTSISREELWDPVTKINAQVMKEVLQKKWENLNKASHLKLWVEKK